MNTHFSIPAVLNILGGIVTEEIYDEGSRWTVYEGALQNLVDEFGRLPGVSPESTQCMVMHILDFEPDEVARLVDVIQAVRKRVRRCEICGNLTEEEACSICRDPRCDPTTLCIVQEPKDIQTVEGSWVFHGCYYVLGEVIDPVHGIGPDQLRIRQLLTRLQDGHITEVTIVTNPNVGGEATAAYLVRILTTIDITTSRLAMGLPMGRDLEYADSATLGHALEGRHSTV